MKVKYSALVSDMRGKLNGSVASKNKGGSYLRNKVTPVNPRTDSQNIVRTRFAQLAQGWRSLTAAQRDAWNAAVSGFAKTDIFGDIKNPSGMNLYVKLNSNLLGVSQPTISSPPNPTGIVTNGFTSFTVDNSDGSVTIVLQGALSAGTACKVFATPGMSAGVNFVKSELRQIGIFTPSSANTHIVSAQYIAKFGSVPAVGTKVFAGWQFVNIATGEMSPMVVVSTIVVA